MEVQKYKELGLICRRLKTVVNLESCKGVRRFCVLIRGNHILLYFQDLHRTLKESGVSGEKGPTLNSTSSDFHLMFL